MKFGIFDQNDRGGLPLAQQYDERLALAQRYDELGFHCYHISEHHATSLSTTPSQGVFLSAVAQRTRRLRLCPLVYLLPIHHPLRLAEEICMLDHLSHGRFEFGIGRGASPHELEALGVDPATAARRYAESFEILQRYFASGTLDHDGEFWRFKDVPVEMTPLQRPHPPLWYALASPDSAVWPARQGINVVCGGPAARVGAISARYREEWEKAKSPGGALPLIGVNRYVVVADTDAQALEIGRRAWPVFYENFIKLWRKHGTQPVNAKLPPDFDSLLASQHAVAGSAQAVAEQLGEQIDAGGLNYLISSFMFGNMPHEAALHSVNLFAEQVMPALEARKAAAVAAL
jgi:alkanesulfonate monooxygenase SsuD/methylene tetrahydromethanopterin reductase-like flavin-dependent oxidoreductase (luciferase family)